MTKKYIVIKSTTIAVAIGFEHPEIKGYSEKVLEAFLPDDKDLERWSEKETDKWISENNKRMEAICKFLNDNKL